MKKIKWLIAILLLQAVNAFSQHVYQIRADSVRIYNICDTAELIIENRTRGVAGFLYNKGNGRTEFRRIRLETVGNNQIAITGQDTLNLSSLSGMGGVDTIYRSGDNIVYIKKGVTYTVNAPVAPNIYTADGILSSFRTVDGNGNSLAFNNLAGFGATSSGSISLIHSNTNAGISFDEGGGVNIIGGSGLGDGNIVLSTSHFNSNINLGTNYLNGNGVVLTGMQNTVDLDSVLTTDDQGKMKLVHKNTLANSNSIYTANGSLTGNRMLFGGLNDLTFSDIGTFTVGTNFGGYMYISGPGSLTGDEFFIGTNASQSGIRSVASDSIQILPVSGYYGLTFRGGKMKYWRNDPLNIDNRIDRFTVDTTGIITGAGLVMNMNNTGNNNFTVAPQHYTIVCSTITANRILTINSGPLVHGRVIKIVLDDPSGVNKWTTNVAYKTGGTTTTTLNATQTLQYDSSISQWRKISE